MVTGASTADVAVILIDARKGVMPQTRRHTFLAHLLGIRHVFVAINKMDLVDYAQVAFDGMCHDFRRFAESLAIPDLRFFPISALRGDMVVERGDAIDWYDGPTLLEALETVPVQDEADALPLRFPVQLVIRGDGGDFRGYGGRLASGVLRVGDEVICLPAGRRTTVREIRTLDGPREIAAAAESVTVRLFDDLDVTRGDLLADPARPPRVVNALAATLCWLDSEPLRRDARYLLKHGTRTVQARITALTDKLDVHTLERVGAGGGVAMNEIARARLTLQQPIAADAYQANRSAGSFILIDPATNHTVAAGLIDEENIQ
jgi:sulfate adenylyltransferase large subunit